MSEPIIRSILDQDLYKITQMQAILRAYEGWDVTYRLITRGDTSIPSSLAARLREEVDNMAKLSLTDKEHDFLRENCPYLKRSYLEFLAGYRFNPSEVRINDRMRESRELSVTIDGPWYRTVLWEVPLMAIISELYFNHLKVRPDDHYGDRAYSKGQQLAKAGCRFADFGTRRRFSRDVHDFVVANLKIGATEKLGKRPSGYSGCMTGTSNVWLAMKHSLRPIGTHSHEWFSAIASQFGYVRANANALKAWQREFMGDLGIALTDTFTSENFFQQFTMDFAKGFDGIRHDSNDPIEFAEKAIACYKRLLINPLHKTIVFSDGLDVGAAISIAKWCQGKIGCAFGIGTHFSNDVVRAKPLNMVIKLESCNGQPAIKLSDVESKHVGDLQTIKAVKRLLGFRD